MTKKAMTCPDNWPDARDAVTRTRLAAFSISSTPMNAMMASRRTSTVTAPILNRMAASTK